MIKNNVVNSRIAGCTKIATPEQLLNQLPLTERQTDFIEHSRQTVADIIAGRDPRLLCVVGPCSIHNIEEALQYAEQLVQLQQQVSDKLFILMRTYFEKPRTRVGWKGFINDPDLDDSFNVSKGIRQARELLLALTEKGLPLATEALDPIVPQFIGDLISWSAIGARTTESQTHREMASGLSMPVGFKNATDGSIQIAVDAMVSASHPHRFLGIDENGQVAVLETTGNADTHLILRGGSRPNYDQDSVADAVARLAQVGQAPRLMIDCSHANSNKDPSRQPAIALQIAKRKAQGEQAIMGIMLESYLNAGAQPLTSRDQLQPGVSITDGCIDWPSTARLLTEIAECL